MIKLKNIIKSASSWSILYIKTTSVHSLVRYYAVATGNAQRI